MFRIRREHLAFGARPSKARRLEFAKLPRLVRDHFIASTSATFPPWPILRAHPRAPGPWAWTIAGVAATFVLAGVAAHGFGDPSSPFVVHPRAAIVLFAAGCAVVAFAFVRASSARRARELPYAAGVYLFPSEVVDARTSILSVHPLGELASIEAFEREVRVRFEDGGAFSFPTADPAASSAAVAQVTRARDALEEAHSAPSLLGLVDPLFVPFDEDVVVTRVPRERGLHFVAAAALIVGPALSLARDAASDRLAYARVAERGDAASLRAYASHGRARVDHVRRHLLPLAELRSLRDLEAIDAWSIANPTAAATDEAARARREALLRRLESLTTVDAIRAFAAAHAGDGVDAAIEGALARVHATAKRRYESSAISSLLSSPSGCGTKLAIVFERGRADLRKADDAVTASRKYAGTPSWPSRHFESASAAESASRAAIAARIGRSFPEGCIVVASAATPGVPVLRVTWTPHFVGTTQSTARPPAVFADLAFQIDLRLFSATGAELAHTRRTVPGAFDPKSVSTFASVLTRRPGDDSIERRVYADLTQRVLLAAAKDANNWLLGPEREPAAGL